MKKLAAFVVWSLVLCGGAFAACQPTQATVGMVGCQSVASSMLGTDSLEVWLPGSFPNSLQLITKNSLFASPPLSGTITAPITFSGGLTGTLTGGASLDLPLAGGTLTGQLNLNNLALSLDTAGANTIDYNSSINSITLKQGSQILEECNVASCSFNVPTVLSYTPATSSLSANIATMTYTTTGTQPSLEFLAANPAGTIPSTGSQCVYCWTISNDTTNTNGNTNGMSGWVYNYQIGFAVTGSHAAATINMDVGGAVTNAGSNSFFNGLDVFARGNAAITAGNANLIAFAPNATIQAGATGYALLESIEGNVGSATTLSGGRFGVTMFSDGSVNGNVFQGDAAYVAAADAGSVQFLTAYAVGRSDSPWGVAPTGTMFGPLIQANGRANGYVPQTAALGLDLGSVNFSSEAYRSPGALISPAGAIFSGNAEISTSGTTTTFDVGGYTGSTSTLSNAGATYVANDQIYDKTYDGIFSVDTVNGSGNISTFHWIQPPHCFGGSCPTTLTLTGGSGNGAAVANVTWTQGLTLALGTTSATAINIGSASANVLFGSGSALATTATVGFPLIPSSAGTPTGTVSGVGAGKVAIEIDTTDKKLCYSVAGGTWECSAAFTP